MNRRTLLGALGLTATGTIALGSGAFSRTSAERSTSLTLAADDQALLTLAPNNDAGAASGGVATFDGPGNLSVQSSADNLLVFDNNELEIEFVDGSLGKPLNNEARFLAADLVRAENNATQSVALDVQSVPTGIDLFAYGSVAGGAVSLVQNSYPVQFDPGTVAGVSLLVDSRQISLGTLQNQIRVVADADQSPNQPTTPDFSPGDL